MPETKDGGETLSAPHAAADFTAANEPFALFAQWIGDAEKTELNDPNAMALATVDGDGLPNVRMVLLKGVDGADASDRGFVFYTNAESRKGWQLSENPFAALCFHWKSLRRQVRVEGSVEETSEAEANAYYNSRPRISRLGSWASQQSRPLPQYSDLQDAVKKYDAEFEGVEDIPRPTYWKGFRVIPQRIEFWIDGEFRLHHRHIFEFENGTWKTHMIYP